MKVAIEQTLNVRVVVLDGELEFLEALLGQLLHKKGLEVLAARAERVQEHEVVDKRRIIRLRCLCLCLRLRLCGLVDLAAIAVLLERVQLKLLVHLDQDVLPELLHLFDAALDRLQHGEEHAELGRYHLDLHVVLAQDARVEQRVDEQILLGEAERADERGGVAEEARLQLLVVQVARHEVEVGVDEQKVAVDEHGYGGAVRAQQVGQVGGLLDEEVVGKVAIVGLVEELRDEIVRDWPRQVRGAQVVVEARRAVLVAQLGALLQPVQVADRLVAVVREDLLGVLDRHQSQVAVGERHGQHYIQNIAFEMTKEKKRNAVIFHKCRVSTFAVRPPRHRGHAHSLMRVVDAPHALPR